MLVTKARKRFDWQWNIKSKEAVAYLVDDGQNNCKNGQFLECLDKNFDQTKEESWDVFRKAVISNDVDIAKMLFKCYPYSIKKALYDIQDLAPNNDLMKAVILQLENNSEEAIALFNPILLKSIEKCDFELMETILQNYSNPR